MQDARKSAENQITIAINTQSGLERLRRLVDELDDGVILSIDFSEVIDDGQEDGKSE